MGSSLWRWLFHLPLLAQCPLLLLSPQFVLSALDNPPQLECLENAMRLHFVPDPDPLAPFGGHVYLKGLTSLAESKHLIFGFFFTAHCHLDYTRLPIAQPFYLHIPYRSECQVKRERYLGGEVATTNASGGMSYSTVVIVQHHRLFVTSRDKAYAVNCFYRETKREFERRLEVGDLTPSEVSAVKEAPMCNYEVLRASSEAGTMESVRYANVGDVLVHRWSCDTADMGMLVHSCAIRDGLGHSFQLLDQRGCVTDRSLLAPLSYSLQLNESSTPISTFKFADQMVVYFSCQITLCDKSDNGCEGITPPLCEMIPLPSEGGPPLPVAATSRDHPPIRLPITFRQQSSSKLAQGRVRDIMEARSGVQLFGRNRFGCCGSGWGNRREKRAAGKGSNATTVERKRKKELVTVDVAADRMIVFTSDEGPSAQERDRLAATLNAPQQKCDAESGPSPLFWLSTLLLCSVFVFALLLQRHLLQRKIAALGTFAPSAMPLEMSGRPTTMFGEHSPAAKPRKYGRF